MPAIDPDSLEFRIVLHLQHNYPVSARDLAHALRIPEKRVLRELHLMETKGHVELDILPDIVYVRCLVVTSRTHAMDGSVTGNGKEGKKGGTGKGRKEKGGGTDPAYL